MKKVSLFALAVSLTTANVASATTPAVPAACPKAFAGFHLGANLGYDLGWGKQRITHTRADGTTHSINNTLGFKGVAGGIGTGYLYRWRQWGLGLAFDAIWSNASGRVRDVDTSTGQSLIGKARLKNSLELYGKFGYVLCGEQAMPFIGLGWANSKWSRKVVRNEVGESRFTAHSSKRYNSLLWKAGVDFLLTKHLVGGIEYTGMDADSKRFTRTNTATGERISYSFKPQDNRISLTLRVVY